MQRGAMARTDDEWSRQMRAALAGDDAAYRRLLAAIAPVLRGIVRARAAAIDAAEGEDIVQEALLAIHLKRATWDQDQPLRPWIYAITRHKLADAFRRRGRAVHLPVEDWGDVLAAPPGPDPTDARDAARLIAALPERDAALLGCIALQGNDRDDCAARLGMTPDTARVVLHRALKRLAALRMKEEGR